MSRNIWTLEGKSKSAIVGSDKTKSSHSLNIIIYSKTLKFKETNINWVFGYYNGDTRNAGEKTSLENIYLDD